VDADSWKVVATPAIVGVGSKKLITKDSPLAQGCLLSLIQRWIIGGEVILQLRNPILEVRSLIVITPDQLQHFFPVVDQQSKPAGPKSLFVGSSGLGGEVSCALLFG
jgi:hypothetical protein